MDALKYLRHFQRSGFREAAQAHPAPEVCQEVESLMQRYFTFLLERKLNSPGFLQQVRKK